MRRPSLTSLLPRGRRAAAVAAALCLVLSGYLAITARDERRVQHADELGRAGHYAAAIAEARRVTRAPAASRARLTQAYAELASGHLQGALRQFREAAHRDPRNFAIHRDWAFALLLAGERGRAQRRMAKALALNPRLQLPPGFTR